jgi:hypothetical protein
MRFRRFNLTAYYLDAVSFGFTELRLGFNAPFHRARNIRGGGLVRHRSKAFFTGHGFKRLRTQALRAERAWAEQIMAQSLLLIQIHFWMRYALHGRACPRSDKEKIHFAESGKVKMRF